MKAEHSECIIDRYTSLINDHVYTEITEYSKDSCLSDLIKTTLIQNNFPIGGLISILVHENYGGDIEAILPAASSLELLRAAISVHYSSERTSDELDTIDALGILSGNLLIAHSINVIRKNITKEVMKSLSDAMLHLINAYFQLENINNSIGFISEVETYMRISREFNVGFLSEAIDIACSLNDINGFQRNLLMRMADYVGTAWQLIQDYKIAREVLKGTAELPHVLLNYPIVYSLTSTRIRPTKLPSIDIISSLLCETNALEHTRQFALSKLERANELCENLTTENFGGFKDLFRMIAI